MPFSLGMRGFGYLRPLYLYFEYMYTYNCLYVVVAASVLVAAFGSTSQDGGDTSIFIIKG